jgi:hypothetical protein
VGQPARPTSYVLHIPLTTIIFTIEFRSQQSHSLLHLINVSFRQFLFCLSQDKPITAISAEPNVGVIPTAGQLETHIACNALTTKIKIEDHMDATEPFREQKNLLYAMSHQKINGHINVLLNSSMPWVKSTNPIKWRLMVKVENLLEAPPFSMKVSPKHSFELVLAHRRVSSVFEAPSVKVIGTASTYDLPSNAISQLIDPSLCIRRANCFCYGVHCAHSDTAARLANQARSHGTCGFGYHSSHTNAQNIEH